MVRAAGTVVPTNCAGHGSACQGPMCNPGLDMSFAHGEKPPVGRTVALMIPAFTCGIWRPRPSPNGHTRRRAWIQVPGRAMEMSHSGGSV